MDYRLLPESSFEEMCEDVADAEGWVRGGVRKEGMGAGLEGELRGKWDGVVDGRRVVVAGASAGAHLALLTVCMPHVLFTSLLMPPSLTDGQRLPSPSCPSTALQISIPSHI